MKTAARIATLIAILAAFWIVLRWAPVAAQRTPRAERMLVELESKLTFNEALDSYPDLALIHQVVEGHGDTAAERVRWLAAHSPCVSGRLSDSAAYARPGNCRWTRNLTPTRAQPRGWIPALDGPWSAMSGRWLAHVDRVRAFVRGEDTHRPCAITPTSWDGARWQAAAEARGWVRVECEGDARNAGYRRAEPGS